MGSVSAQLFSRAVSIMLNEACFGPADAGGSWFADVDPESGIMGALAALSAVEASQVREGGAGVAGHAAHLRFALRLANRGLRGENPYPGADWKSSWTPSIVDENSWTELRRDLQAECESLAGAVADPEAWTIETNVPLILSQIAHCAWHLGAIRQALGLVVPPKS